MPASGHSSDLRTVGQCYHLQLLIVVQVFEHLPHFLSCFFRLECLMLLAKADPCCLSKSNDWQLTPLSVAFLKGFLFSIQVP